LFDFSANDFKAWAKGLKECGYATNPKYPDLLIRIIHEHKLDQYDEIGMQYLNKGTLPARVGLPVAKGEKKKDKNPTVLKPGNTGGGKDDIREIHLGPARETFVSSNDVKFVEAKEGELPADIAEEFDMGTWQILNYNNIESTDKLKEKQVIYLQPKRARATQDTYTVKPGDNTWSISQQFAIRMKKLRKLNGLAEGAEPSAGTTLKLR
jgi:LysM repeat protein